MMNAIIHQKSHYSDKKLRKVLLLAELPRTLYHVHPFASRSVQSGEYRAESRSKLSNPRPRQVKSDH